MSDLLLPFLLLLEDDALAFWCFAALMQRHGARANFAVDERGMFGQLRRLAEVCEATTSRTSPLWCMSCAVLALVPYIYAIPMPPPPAQLPLRHAACFPQLLDMSDKPLTFRLHQLGAAECHFAYRMLVVLMRRDLPLPQVCGNTCVCMCARACV